MVVVVGYLSFGTWWLQRAGCKVAAVAHANSVNFGPAPSSWERAIELVMLGCCQQILETGERAWPLPTDTGNRRKNGGYSLSSWFRSKCMDSVMSPAIAQNTQEVAVGGGAVIRVLIDRFGKNGVSGLQVIC